MRLIFSICNIDEPVDQWPECLCGRNQCKFIITAIIWNKIRISEILEACKFCLLKVGTENWLNRNELLTATLFIMWSVIYNGYLKFADWFGWFWFKSFYRPSTVSHVWPSHLISMKNWKDLYCGAFNKDRGSLMENPPTSYFNLGHR